MAVANDSHFAKDFSNPGQNTAEIGRNWSFVRGDTVAETAKVVASLGFHLLDLYKEVPY
jgi:hypothetical protein